MTDPVNVSFRDIIADAKAIAAEAAALDDPVTQGEALVRVGRLLGDIGQTGEGEQVVAQAKECFDRAGVVSAELAFLMALTFSSWQGKRPIEEEIVRAEHVLSSSDEASPLAAYTALGLAASLAMVGRFDEARSLGRRGASILRELGMALELAATAGMSISMVEMLASDLEAAEAAIRPAFDTLKEMGELGRLSSRAAVLGDVLYGQGRIEEALTIAEEAIAISAVDDMEPQIWSRSVRARALASLQRFDEAEREARMSVALSEATDWPWYQGTAWLALAEVLHLAARKKDAAEAASEAEVRFERKGSSVMASRARAFREELEAGRADG
jgi:tetratricopeptide (TPR) repeat protein